MYGTYGKVCVRETDQPGKDMCASIGRERNGQKVLTWCIFADDRLMAEFQVVVLAGGNGNR